MSHHLREDLITLSYDGMDYECVCDVVTTYLSQYMYICDRRANNHTLISVTIVLTMTSTRVS